MHFSYMQTNCTTPSRYNVYKNKINKKKMFILKIIFQTISILWKTNKIPLKTFSLNKTKWTFSCIKFGSNSINNEMCFRVVHTLWSTCHIIVSIDIVWFCAFKKKVYRALRFKWSMFVIYNNEFSEWVYSVFMYFSSFF